MQDRIVWTQCDDVQAWCDSLAEYRVSRDHGGFAVYVNLILNWCAVWCTLYPHLFFLRLTPWAVPTRRGATARNTTPHCPVHGHGRYTYPYQKKEKNHIKSLVCHFQNYCMHSIFQGKIDILLKWNRIIKIINNIRPLTVFNLVSVWTTKTKNYNQKMAF